MVLQACLRCLRLFPCLPPSSTLWQASCPESWCLAISSPSWPGVAWHHRCRKFFTFWERSDTIRKFLSELHMFGVSRSKKRLNIAEFFLNMEKFDWFMFHLRTFLHYTSNIFIYIFMILIIFLNNSASSNNFWEHCSCVPPLFAPMLDTILLPRSSSELC
jgi:hypothetical protein